MSHFAAQFSQTVSNITTNGLGPVMDVSDYMHAASAMTRCSMVVRRTAGATDAVNITLKVSFDGVNFADVGGATPGPGFGAPYAVTYFGFGNNPAWAGFAGLPFCYVRYNVQNIGVGNTLEIQLLAAN